MALFRKMTRENSFDPRGFLGLGYTYMAMQQYDSAIAEFREAVALDPRSAPAQHALGQEQPYPLRKPRTQGMGQLFKGS